MDNVCVELLECDNFCLKEGLLNLFNPLKSKLL
jgi:hypothetical protein